MFLFLTFVFVQEYKVTNVSSQGKINMVVCLNVQDCKLHAGNYDEVKSCKHDGRERNGLNCIYQNTTGFLTE
jgi:hypothetical protein